MDINPPASPNTAIKEGKLLFVTFILKPKWVMTTLTGLLERANVVNSGMQDTSTGYLLVQIYEVEIIEEVAHLGSTLYE